MKRSREASGSVPWWRQFFESPDSLRLAFFPSQEVTDFQVSALDEMLTSWGARLSLDLCCGHGRHCVPLRRCGHTTIGVDASSLMVTRLQSASAAAGVPSHVVQGDATCLPFADCVFDAALCLFNSFGYLETDEGNQGALDEAARCLRPGGWFLLDTRNRSYQLSYLPFSEIIPVESGGAVWLECDQDERGKRLVSVFRQVGTGETLYRASIRVYAQDELFEMLRRAGLEIADTYGGYDLRPFSARSRELLIVARKR